MSKFMRAGGAAAGLCCVVVFAANGFTSTGDVVVAGSVITDAPMAAVRHPTGGIVAEIRRRNGDHVKSGELLARLDDSVIRTNLVQSSASLDDLLARKARLEAERDGKDALTLPPVLADRLADAGVTAAVSRERNMFAARAEARRAEKALQYYRIRLLEEEIAGLEVQARSKAAEMSLVERELEGIRQLRSQNLAPMQRLMALERDAVRIGGERDGSVPIGLAQARARIADTELQLIRGDRDSLRDIVYELRDVDEKLADALRRKIDFEEQLKRAEIVSPQDGIVLSSAIAAAGFPVPPGKDIMLIAPPDRKAAVEARMDARSAARLRIGQEARLAVLSSAGPGGELTGRLERILPAAADASELARQDVTLHFVLGPEAEASLAALPPGTSVRVSIAPGTYGRGLLDLVGVTKPLGRIEQALL